MNNRSEMQHTHIMHIHNIHSCVYCLGGYIYFIDQVERLLLVSYFIALFTKFLVKEFKVAYLEGAENQRIEKKRLNHSYRFTCVFSNECFRSVFAPNQNPI